MLLHSFCTTAISYPILSRFSGLCSSPALILWRPDQFFLFLHTSSISHGHILWFNFLLCCGNAACPFCQHTAQWQLVQLLITLFFVLCIILPALQTYILYWHTLMPLLLKITKEKAYLIELFFLKLHRSWSVNHCSIQSLLQITVVSPCYNFWRQYPNFLPGLNQDQLFDSHPSKYLHHSASFTASTCVFQQFFSHHSLACKALPLHFSPRRLSQHHLLVIIPSGPSIPGLD